MRHQVHAVSHRPQRQPRRSRHLRLPAIRPFARPPRSISVTPDFRALANAQLAAFAAREPEIQAFVCADVDAARRQLAAPMPGPLSGALIGIKDIIATEDFPTRCGDPDLPDGAIPRRDAWVVARLKSLGAIILGKTVCTRFGIPIPGPTRNPHDLRHTPGGSSSGSAAAVAAGFVSFAIGTQTAGSTIRPASYCGVVGYKPSFGLLSTEGVQPLSTTLDHIGIFAQSPRDAWFLTTAMLLREPVVITPCRPSHLCILDIPGHACPGLADMLSAADIEVDVAPLPVPWRDFTDLQKDICYWEAARLLLSQQTIPIAPPLQELLETMRGAISASIPPFYNNGQTTKRTSMLWPANTMQSFYPPHPARHRCITTRATP